MESSAPSMHHKRCSLASCVQGSYIYVTGGLETEENKGWRSIERLDAKSVIRGDETASWQLFEVPFIGTVLGKPLMMPIASKEILIFYERINLSQTMQFTLDTKTMQFGQTFKSIAPSFDAMNCFAIGSGQIVLQTSS